LAAKEGFPQICQYLISNQADVNLKNADGKTPLHLACNIGSTEIIEMLIKNGANINDVTIKDLNTPSHILAKYGYSNALKMLL